MLSMAWADLTIGKKTYRFNGTQGTASADGLFITEDGVEGWYDTPALKTSVTARGSGDGAHDVPDSDICYGTRTVTVHAAAVGAQREQTVVNLMQASLAAHNTVTFRMVDGGQDAQVSGHVSMSVEKWHERYTLFTLNIVCARPERLSANILRFQLFPASTGDNGLRYGDNKLGLQYPLTYGTAATDARNVGTIVNNGTSRAYPVFAVNGVFSSVQLMFPGTDLSLDYAQPVGATPLVLDCRSRTATMGGLDVSRNLRSRGFPTVEPDGSLSVNLQSAGTGWITVESHDTYM